jgi:hypothetical protein
MLGSGDRLRDGHGRKKSVGWISMRLDLGEATAARPGLGEPGVELAEE